MSKQIRGRGMPRRKEGSPDRQLMSLGAATSPPHAMPLAHVTAAWTAKEIAKSAQLVTKKCSIFNKELLYFFLMRPAYSLKFGSEPSHQISRFPAVFLMRPSSVPTPYHVYPFDTGGAANGAFEAQADKYVPLEDYALEPSHAAAQRFMLWAFEDGSAYFDGRLKSDLHEKIRPFESVAVGYVDVAKMGVDGSNDHDKRSSAIEISSASNVDMIDNTELVIVPKQFIEGNLDFIANILRIGAKIRTYDWKPNFSPNEFQEEIFRITRKWLYKKSIIQRD